MSGGRPKFDLLPWQDILYSWYILEDRTVECCRQAFEDTYPALVYPSIPTLKRIFAEWEFRKRDDELLRNPELHVRIWQLFYDQCLSDEHITMAGEERWVRNQQTTVSKKDS